MNNTPDPVARKTEVQLPAISLSESAPSSLNKGDLLSELQNERRDQSKSLLDICSPQSALAQLNPNAMQQITDAMAEIRRSQNLTPVQKEEVVKSLIEDLTKPEKVNQGLMATCVPTTLQHKFAPTDPLQYTLMIRDLVVNGEFTFKDPEGTKIKLNRQALLADVINVPQPFEQRSITERIVQDVLMRYAVGDQIVYDNKTDTSRGTYQDQQVVFKGLCKDHIERMISGLTGKQCQRLDNTTPSSTSQIIEDIDHHSKTTGGTLVELRWASSGEHQLHMLMVKEIIGDRVVLFNPHGAVNPPPTPGAIQEMSLNEFSRKLSCAFVVTDQPYNGTVTSPPTLARRPEAEAKHPLANDQGQIEFHISADFIPPAGTQSSTLKVVEPEYLQKVSSATEHQEKNNHNNIASEVTANPAASTTLAKNRQRAFYRPLTAVQISDDDELI